MADISVIIPTYDEKKNITRLIPRTASILIGHDYELIVVDDSSSDGSAEAARELANDYPVKVLVRLGKLDLSSVVVEGFKDGSKIKDIGYFFLKRKEIPIAFKAREKEESKLGIGEHVSYLNLLLHNCRFNLITIYQPVTCHTRSVR